MRKDVKKFLLIGPKEEQERFFRNAQEMGIIQFINPNSKISKAVPGEVQNVTAAIKVLRGLPTVEQEESYQTADADLIVNRILTLSEQRETLDEKIRSLSQDINKIHVLGNFSLEDKAYVEKESRRVIQFFSARPSLFQDEPVPDNLIYLASDHGMDYYMSINEMPVSYDKMIEIKIDRSLKDLRKELLEAEHQHHQIEKDLKGYAKYNDILHHVLIKKLNHYHLYDAQTYVQHALGGSLFAVEGWVPVTKLGDLEKLTDRQHIFCEEIAIEPQDATPTYLENKGFARLGEDLVHVYDTPSDTDKDPSNWVLYSFALFFAFIIGDAGYGLVYLTIALFLRYKFPDAKGAGKRFINLFTLLSVGCILWGTLMTSFFGMQIAYDNPIRKVSLVQWLAKKRMTYNITHQNASYQEWVKKYPELAAEKDPEKFFAFTPAADPAKGNVILHKLVDSTLFELALFIGIVHLVLSLLRYSLRTWAHFGWALFLVGGYLYFSHHLHLPSFMNTVFGIDLEKGGEFGFELMCAGLGIACVLSIIQNGWTGIFEPMNIIQLFADSLSYLRLYALALAGAIVAGTVNEIASGVPLIFSVLLIVGSHLINIVLGTMSGIIHGLRLNYLEWYRWSFAGGGKEFKPLKLLKME